MTNALCVFLGGGIGSVLRYMAGCVIPSSTFPWVTFAVNASGGLLIGLFSAWTVRFGWNDTLRLSLTVGLCGGFTTFSTFSKDSLALAQSGRWGAFAAYTTGSIVMGMAAVALGYVMAKQ